MDRYARQDLIDWLPRDRVAGTKIAVIGAGAVGNEVIKNFTLLGVGEIHVFDLDIIEEHNLTRSVLFRETDVGKAKAVIAAMRASELDPNVKVIPHVGDFWDLLSIDAAARLDLLLCCVDNFEARLRCNALAQIAQINFVNLGIDHRHCVVETFPFAQASEGGCYECALPDSVYQRMATRYSCGHLKKISHVERRIPTTIMTSAIAAGLATSLGIRLSDSELGASPERILVDTISGTTSKATLEAKPACPGCSVVPFGSPVIRASRAVGLLADQWSEDAMILLSEPVLVSHQLPDQERVLVFRRASDFDDSYPASLSDDPDSVVLEVRDSFTAGEFFARFADMKVPTKYAVAQFDSRTAIFDFGSDQ